MGEERQSAELRNTLERVRRQHNAAVNERRESNLREQMIIEMQSDGDVRLPTDRRPRETVQKQGHSWAAALTESKPDRAQPPAAAVARAQPPVALLANSVPSGPGPPGPRVVVTREGV